MTSRERVEAKVAYQATLRDAVRSYQEINGFNMFQMSKLIKMNNGTFKTFMEDRHQPSHRTIEMLERFLSKDKRQDHECCCCMKDE